jgi:hypothetical protein
VYVRVSTPNQMQKQTSEQPVDRLRVFLAEQHEDLADDHIFRDAGFSAAERICVGPAWIACGMQSLGRSSIAC